MHPTKDKTVRNAYSEGFISDIIRMAWADEISFDKIKKERGLSESEVITLMRNNLKAGIFRLWRKRVTDRKSKHEKRSALLSQVIDSYHTHGV